MEVVTRFEKLGEVHSIENSSKRAYGARWVILAVVLIAEVMDLLDSTVVGVAAPTIRAKLGGGYATTQWLAAAYTLPFAVTLITGGRLGDIFSRRRVFLGALAGFTCASLACGTANSMGLLLGLRAIQGVFAALMIPQSYGVVTDVFPRKERAGAFALFGPVMALAAIGGPVLAGAIVGHSGEGNWRLIFFLNVPLGLVALVVGHRVLPHDGGTPGTRFDPVGVVLVTVASLLIVYPLVQGQENDWPVWMFGSFVLAVPCLVAFVVWERLLLRRGGSPLLHPGLMARTQFRASLIVGLLFFGTLGALLLILGLFLQIGLGWTPLRAGLQNVPIAGGVAVGAVLAGGPLAKFGRSTLQVGSLVVVGGTALSAWVLHNSGDTVTGRALTPGLLVLGFGVGMVLTPFFDIALASVSNEETGTASGVLNAAQQMGTTLGVAVFGTLFYSKLDPAHAGTSMVWVFLAMTGLAVVVLASTTLMPRHARDEADDS
jgi:EmrB/QacA subfamily drug resistance transporter